MLVNVELGFIWSDVELGSKYIWLLIFNYNVEEIDLLLNGELLLEKVRVNFCRFLKIWMFVLWDELIIDIWKR